MSAIPYCADVLDRSVSLLQLPDVAKNVGLAVTKVHQMLRDRSLIAIRRDGVVGIPEAFFDDDGQILQRLPGLLSVLHDGGFTDEEILEWLFREDDSLPGAPIVAMRGDLAREVIRRAQAAAF
ncbi:MAG: DNA-binding protein [Rhodococcus sp.]|nr:DNA-binding protein [Rhodococcus sp. (in: high G+C Gram-positive bacteria)]